MNDVFSNKAINVKFTNPIDIDSFDTAMVITSPKGVFDVKLLNSGIITLLL